MLLTVAGVVALLGAVTPAIAGDCKGCKIVAKKGEGFCGGCNKGKAFGVELTSRKLYDQLAGHSVDIEKMKCSGCKHAAATGGRCSHCNVGIVNGKAYASTVAHTLAKGMTVNVEKAAKCGGCKTAIKDQGRCSACDVGFVAGRAFSGEDAYKAAKAAYATLVKAVGMAKDCASCAIALVTDGECKDCKIKFKDGQKTG